MGPVEPHEEPEVVKVKEVGGSCTVSSEIDVMTKKIRSKVAKKMNLARTRVTNSKGLQRQN